MGDPIALLPRGRDHCERKPEESDRFMSLSARVLVAAGQASDAAALAARLEAYGIEAVAAAGEDGARAASRARAFDAIVFYRLDASEVALSRLAIELKARAHPRLLVLIAAGERLDPAHPPDGLDAALPGDAHPAQVAARLKLFLRLAVMEDEARLRAATLAQRGVRVNLDLDAASLTAPHVLFIGDPSPAYLGLEAALNDLGATAAAAFTSFTAFDFLHERDFDGVVINAIGKADAAFTMCTALRRNTRLFHTPAALLIDAGFDRVEDAFRDGAADLLPIDEAPAILARRVVSLARERRRRESVKAAFGRVRASDTIETATGLAAAGFFDEHFENMARRAHRLERPLSLIVARAQTPAETPALERDLALRQIGSMIGRLMRAEDFATQIEPGVYVVAMPGAGRAAAEGAAHRIAAVAECTAFGGGTEAEAFQVEVRCEVGQLAPEETARGLLARTVDAFLRPRAPRADAAEGS